MKIMTTKNYSLFKTLDGNRALRVAHVRNLTESIKKNNLMRYQPVLVTQDHYIIDGQHRVAAAKSLEIPVHYIVIPSSSLRTVQLLNSTMKPWSLMDFCESFMTLGNEDYKELLAFTKQHNAPLALSAELLSNKAISESGHTASVLRNGTFKVTNRQGAIATIEKISQIRAFADAGVATGREFLSALSTLYKKGMKHDLLLDRLKVSGKKIHRQASKRDYIFSLLDIYNYGLKKNRIEISL